MPVASTPVLLAHSYYLRYDPKQQKRMKPYAPLATLYVAAVLREAGYRVELFDAMLSDGTAEFAATLQRVRPAIVGIVEDNFNYLTKMCVTRMREAAFDMLRTSRAAGCRTFVNGSDATDHAESYLSAGADAVVVGEPEATALELVEAWSTGRPWRDTPGLTYAAGDSIVRTADRPFLDALDELPMPAWDLVDAEGYRRAWRDRHGHFSWGAVTSRGCPYRCNWCAKPIFGTRYAQHSPERVADEFAALKRTVAPDHVWFADDIFGLSARWIEAFADAVEARQARIPFMMQSRANLMTPSVVHALQRAGAEEVWLGAESGSQEILDAMDKGTTLEQVGDATHRLREAGIRPCWFIQLGYPGENWQRLLQTRDMIRHHRPAEIGVSVAYPLPGTAFYDAVKAEMGTQTNWRHSDDLAMMFTGLFSTAFYREVRSLLHDEVDAGPNPTAEQQKGFERRWQELAERREDRRPAATQTC